MSKVKSALPNIRVRLQHRKDDISSKLDHDHKESRGRSYDHIARIIHDKVDWSSGEDDEQDGLHSQSGKKLNDFLQNNDPQEIRWLHQTPRLSFTEGAEMVNDSGWRTESGDQQSEHEDLPTKGESCLGELVKDNYKTDYYILDKFPTAARSFFTMLEPKNNKFTISFDFMVQRQEVLPGGQRVHDYKILAQRMEELDMNTELLKESIEGFEWVAPPHAGAGIGLERLLSLILDMGNLRYATLFPKDPKSFPQPKLSSALRHPEDGTLQRPKGHLPALYNLIANYALLSRALLIPETRRGPSAQAARVNLRLETILVR